MVVVTLQLGAALPVPLPPRALLFHPFPVLRPPFYPVSCFPAGCPAGPIPPPPRTTYLLLPYPLLSLPLPLSPPPTPSLCIARWARVGVDAQHAIKRAARRHPSSAPSSRSRSKVKVLSVATVQRGHWCTPKPHSPPPTPYPTKKQTLRRIVIRAPVGPTRARASESANCSCSTSTVTNDFATTRPAPRPTPAAYASLLGSCLSGGFLTTSDTILFCPNPFPLCRAPTVPPHPLPPPLSGSPVPCVSAHWSIPCPSLPLPSGSWHLEVLRHRHRDLMAGSHS